MSELKVTSIEQLKKDSSGELVELPPFSAGTHFVARLKRPSMMELATNGTIPNSLIVRAQELFNADEGHVFDTEDDTLLKEMYEVLKVLCEQCFSEPKYSELVDADIKLTDQQMLFVFNYVQHGINALDTFRTIEENGERTSDGKNVSQTAVGDTKD